jgi:hypothetical protein
MIDIHHLHLLQESGTASQDKKRARIKALLVAARDCEPTYLMRQLGVSWRSSCIARAVSWLLEGRSLCLVAFCALITPIEMLVAMVLRGVSLHKRLYKSCFSEQGFGRFMKDIPQRIWTLSWNKRVVRVLEE